MTSRTFMAAAAAALLAAGLGASARAAEFSYAEAAKPFKGVSIRVLDEVTPLQEVLAKLVPGFEQETGIKVDYQLLGHMEVINRGQADMLSGRGYFDAVMLHGFQMGQMLEAEALLPIDSLIADKTLSNPNLETADLIERPYKTVAFFGGKQYGFVNWNYNHVYWARADLLDDEGEKAAFKAKYGYDLAPAKTLEQLRDIAEFFTRKKGATLAGKPLDSDFYGIVFDGVKGSASLFSFVNNILKNYGGDIVDASGKPNFDTPATVAALKLYADLWKFAPPGTAEYSLLDVPTVMGNGIAAQSMAFSDFVLGVDKPGASPFAGKFVYGGIPVKAGADPKFASAEAEPSLVAIGASSKHPEATFLFIQWLADKKQQEALLNAGQGGVPIRESSWELPVLKASANPTLFKAMKDTLSVAEAKPRMPKYLELSDALSAVVQQVGMGRLTPEQGAAEGQKALVRVCGDKCTL
ncbi:extracellular solute-binding protein [Methylopila sp. Yamaguchi]|uniref:extracellular solute-binding protein n=1 Tax=Methylopila sp. Yamaguchi TaxID=1437817 RepID=UPI000CCBF8ED|nr:extracellular solute-binding protein [Methylopila sp. Yamaguchi]